MSNGSGAGERPPRVVRLPTAKSDEEIARLDEENRRSTAEMDAFATKILAELAYEQQLHQTDVADVVRQITEEFGNEPIALGQRLKEDESRLRSEDPQRLREMARLYLRLRLEKKMDLIDAIATNIINEYGSDPEINDKLKEIEGTLGRYGRIHDIGRLLEMRSRSGLAPEVLLGLARMWQTLRTTGRLPDTLA